MKKLIVFIIINILIFVSCSSMPEKTENEDIQMIQSKKNDYTYKSIPINSFYYFNSGEYNVEPSLTVGNTFKISYPILKNLVDISIMNSINNDINTLIKEYEKRSSEGYVDIDYDISRKSNNILSIVFEGTINIKNVENKIRDTLNFDLTTSNQINVETLLNLDINYKAMVNSVFSQYTKLISGEKATVEIPSNAIINFTREQLIIEYTDSNQKRQLRVTIPISEIETFLNQKY